VCCNWPMSAHASQAFSIAHCTDSEDLLPNGLYFINNVSFYSLRVACSTLCYALVLKSVSCTVPVKFERIGRNSYQPMALSAGVDRKSVHSLHCHLLVVHTSYIEQ